MLYLSVQAMDQATTNIKLLILDVDGVLTDGRLTTTADGEAGSASGLARAFHVHDGCAIKLWLHSGHQAAILSGRKSAGVARRADELGIKWVHMGISDKLAAYEVILAEAGCEDPQVAYFGDDLPDIPPMLRCGFSAAVANAVPSVKRVAHYVSGCGGGSGAVAELVELLLRRQGLWNRELLTAVMA
jgi:3-deoxy-D-manno-octulosonate 8-phosphate phosphatase (KDO 8-P phosphatase)